MEICVAGLELDALYKVILEVQRVDGERYKYTNCTHNWTKSLKLDMEFAATVSDSHSWTHPASSNTGSFWVKDSIDCKAAKLSNDPTTAINQVSRLAN